MLQPVDLLAGPDGGVISISRAWSNGSLQGAAEIVVVALDANGDPLWNWEATSPADPWGFGLEGQYVAGATDDAGRLYLTYSLPMQSRLVAFDHHGSVRWQRSITEPSGAPHYHTTCVATNPTGGVHVGGSAYVDTFPIGAVHSFDADGVLLWEQSVAQSPSGPVSSLPFGLLIGPGGESYLYGQHDFFTGYSYFGCLHVFSPSGNLLAGLGGGSSIESAFCHAALDSNGGLSLVETGYTSGFFGGDRIFRLTGFSLSGSAPTGVNLASVPGAFYSVRDLAVLPNGDRLIAHSEATPRLLRVAHDGTQLTPWTLPGNPPGELFGVLAMPDGSAVVTGFLDAPSRTFYARFDPTGVIEWIGDVSGVHVAFWPQREALPVPTDYDLTQDDRGNVFVAGRRQTTTGGTSLTTAKLLQGGPVGTAYCGPAVPNSTGAPGQLRVFGTDVRSLDNLTLLATDLPAGSAVMMLASQQQGLVFQPGGSSGVLCLGGTIGRYAAPGQIRHVTGAGSTSLQLDLDTIPRPNSVYSAVAGQTWSFQAWYRDASGSVATSNFTQAVAVPLQ
ncbi:PQQ-binding-like beta-propeller repeat protein [Planctomycetes bacterium Poly30]|uniref:PQQ-binding-like beta-propeller repeat protein n=1 Tax=Saltatorellus ferox TaxID=2528018 RepID=UPI0011A70634